MHRCPRWAPDARPAWTSPARWRRSVGSCSSRTSSRSPAAPTDCPVARSGSRPGTARGWAERLGACRRATRAGPRRAGRERGDADHRASEPEAADAGAPASGPDRGRFHRPRRRRTPAVRLVRDRRGQPGLDARESTGLTRPDYFNWPAELGDDVRSVQPQVVVVMIGANDPQDFLGPPDVPYSSPQWNTLYAQRVAQFMRIASSGGAQVVWVGMPPMQDATLNAQMQDLNTVVQRQARLARPSVTFVLHRQDPGRAPGGLHGVRHQCGRAGRQRAHARRDPPDHRRGAARGTAGHRRTPDARLPPALRGRRQTRGHG